MSNNHQKNTKHCIICGKEFERTNFPQCFDRMITCGGGDCVNQRRYELWRTRYNRYKRTQISE